MNDVPPELLEFLQKHHVIERDRDCKGHFVLGLILGFILSTALVMLCDYWDINITKVLLP